MLQNFLGGPLGLLFRWSPWVKSLWGPLGSFGSFFRSIPVVSGFSSCLFGAFRWLLGEYFKNSLGGTWVRGIRFGPFWWSPGVGMPPPLVGFFRGWSPGVKFFRRAPGVCSIHSGCPLVLQKTSWCPLDSFVAVRCIPVVPRGKQNSWFHRSSFRSFGSFRWSPGENYFSKNLTGSPSVSRIRSRLFGASGGSRGNIQKSLGRPPRLEGSVRGCSVHCGGPQG